MSWSYEGNLDNYKDWIRFTIGDTNEFAALLQDEEIEGLYNMNSQDKIATAKECMKHILLELSLSAVDYSLGPESVKASQRYKQYQARYEALNKSTFASYGGISPDRPGGIFSVGMMDNHSEVG